MKNFTDKICPYCKTSFLPEDDVVVCSDCEMPHHRDCWIDNKACTTFGCSGSIAGRTYTNSAGQSPAISLDDTPDLAFVKFCSRCGSKQQKPQKFCTACGHSLQDKALNLSNSREASYDYQPHQETASNQSTTESIMPLVINNESYYREKFNLLTSQNKKTAWNWAAFFFSGYWLIYRKMYKHGLILLGVSLLPIYDNSLTILLASMVPILIGLFGNFLYMKDLQARSSALGHTSPVDRQNIFQKAGGVNSTLVGVTVIGYIILYTMIN